MIRGGRIIQILLVLGVLFFINVIASFFHGFIDLTEDKRYTITDPTVQVVEGMEEFVYVKVLLDGDFPAGFKRLQNATRDLLEDFRAINPRIQYVFEDPTEGTREEIIKRRDELAEQGIVPTSLQYYDGTETVTKPIFPFAIINIGSLMAAVPLLEEQQPGVDENIILNNSVSLLEYKFADALQKMTYKDPKNIIFTSGHGELPIAATYDLEKSLRKFHNTGRIHLDSVVHLDDDIDLLIVAAPRQPLGQKNKFKIDQYIMNGGKVIWLVEKLDADLDSIAAFKFYVPKDIDTDIDEMLFKYGARVNPNLIIDMESTRIPQVAGMQGDKPQMQLFTWPYHLAVAPKSNHPIVKNLDRINMFFPSSIDTVKTVTPVKKTVLLSSSDYSRLQYNPVRLTFEIFKIQMEPDKFNDGNQPVAVLLEGKFESVYKNRVTQDFKNTLQQLNLEFKDQSVPTKQIVVSDVDFAKSLMNNRTGTPEKMGFNKWEVRYFKGNADFILNAIEYMLDERGVLQARSKEIKLRLLDKVKTKQEKTKWQLINIVFPLVFILVFGGVFNYIRKHRYGKQQ